MERRSRVGRSLPCGCGSAHDGDRQLTERQERERVDSGRREEIFWKRKGDGAKGTRYTQGIEQHRVASGQVPLRHTPYGSQWQTVGKARERVSQAGTHTHTTCNERRINGSVSSRSSLPAFLSPCVHVLSLDSLSSFSQSGGLTFNVLNPERRNQKSNTQHPFSMNEMIKERYTSAQFFPGC